MRRRLRDAIAVAAMLLWPGADAAADSLGAAVEAALADWVRPLGATRVQIDLPEAAMSHRAFAGAAIVARLPAHAPRPGPVVVECELVNAQGARHLVAVPCKVFVRRVVPVAAARLPRHRVLEEDDVRWKEMEFSATGCWPEGASELTGRRLRRGIEPGAVVLTDLLESVPEVERGDAVDVIVRENGLEVRLEAVALEDGRAGEEIRLRNKDSRRVVRAVVTAPGCAEVAG